MLPALAGVVHHRQGAAGSDDNHRGQHDEYSLHWRPRHCGPPTSKSNRAADEPTLNERQPRWNGRTGFHTPFDLPGMPDPGSVLPQQSGPEGALFSVSAAIAVR